MITEELCDLKSTLSELTEPIMIYPQYMKSLRVKDKAAAVSDEEVLKEVAAVEKAIDGKGRVLLRQSGTEPVIRIMVEAESEKKCADFTNRIAAVVEERGHTIG